MKLTIQREKVFHDTILWSLWIERKKTDLGSLRFDQHLSRTLQGSEFECLTGYKYKNIKQIIKTM